METTLDIILVVLLAATLYQAIRLERALGVMKRDRASFESLVAGFNSSTSRAESGIQQLRAAADGTGREIESQLTKYISLKDDLEFLTDRADRQADRLETLVRSARPLTQDRTGSDRPTLDRPTLDRSIADRAVSDRHAQDRQVQVRQAQDRQAVTAGAGPARNASQAERDLLQALRMAR